MATYTTIKASELEIRNTVYMGIEYGNQTVLEIVEFARADSYTLVSAGFSPEIGNQLL